MMRQLLMCSMATAGLLVWSAGAHAAVISFNIDIAGTIGGDGNVNASGQSPADALAGVVSVGNWTGTWNGSFQNFGPTDLIDSDGNATTMDISSLAAFDFNIAGGHPGQDADGTWNKELINGYMNSGASSNPSVSMFTLSEIPYAVYDIIAYFSSDAEGRSGAVTDGATTYDFSTLGGPSVGGADAVLTQTTSTGGSNPPANYAIFRGLSGASQTITASIPDFGGLAGIQVVQVVPEPAALSLVALGMACAVRRRRR